MSANPKPARACPECRSTHNHWGWCQSKGYSNVGPHPDAPVPENQRVPQSAEPDYCCGGTCLRELCFIHAGLPKAQAAPKPTHWELEFKGCRQAGFHFETQAKAQDFIFNVLNSEPGYTAVAVY